MRIDVNLKGLLAVGATVAMLATACTGGTEPLDPAEAEQRLDELVGAIDWEDALVTRRQAVTPPVPDLAATLPGIDHGDHTDRFTYWPVRTTKGGEMLWAGTPASEIQVIDVRDLANFVVDCVERKTAGSYNMVTPVGSYAMGNLLEDSQAVLAATVDPVWVDDAFIEEQKAGDNGALPIWHPVTGPYAHVSSVSGERARAAGLKNRPVRETIRDLMTWWDTLPEERIANAGFGMTAEREAELITAWKAANA